MGYYWIYYLAPILLAYSQQNPLFILLVLFFLVIRKWLPDPVVILRNLGRISSLKRQGAPECGQRDGAARSRDRVSRAPHAAVGVEVPR